MHRARGLRARDKKERGGGGSVVTGWGWGSVAGHQF